jgi:hypothetical protein
VIGVGGDHELAGFARHQMLLFTLTQTLEMDAAIGIPWLSKTPGILSLKGI